MNTFIFEFGDWSGDGHGMTNSQIISSDLTSEEFDDYLSKIHETLGFNLENICEEYEDNVLPDDLVNYLKETNFDFENANIEIEKSESNKNYIILHENKRYCKSIFIEGSLIFS